MTMQFCHDRLTSRDATIRDSSELRRHASAFPLLMICLSLAVGCGTTINRAGTEQLLLSDAIDSAVNQISFHHFDGQRCYLDTSYLRPNAGNGIINSEYVISSLRQQITVSGGLLMERRADADIIVEPRLGALGTNGHEVVYGIPQGGAIAGAATAFSNVPVPAIPEIAFGKNDAQSGIAKISVFAYDRVTRAPIWQSGIAKAESTSDNTWVLGAGPFQKGSVYEGIRFAGKKLPNSDLIEGEEHNPAGYEQARLFDHTKGNATAAASQPKPKQSSAPATAGSDIKRVSHESPVSDNAIKQLKPLPIE